MPIDALPSISRSDPDFRVKVDDYFLTRLPTFSTQAESARVQIVAAEGTATSAASTATGAATTASNAATTATTAAGTATSASASAVTAKNAAEAAAAAAATFDPAAYVPKAGATMTGHLVVPAGASGSQAPRASEVVLQTQLQTSALDTTANRVLKVGGFGIGSVTPQQTDANSLPLGSFTRILVSNRAEAVAANLPALQNDSSAHFNLLTFGEATRTTQIAMQAFSVNNQGIWIRQKHDSTWYPWVKLSGHAEPAIAATGGVMDCALGDAFILNMSGNVTLSFANIPTRVYECVLEVNHTSGTLTMPSGTIWVSTAPTLTTNKRHLIFFRRAQLGTAGWYASALAGYSQ